MDEVDPVDGVDETNRGASAMRVSAVLIVVSLLSTSMSAGAVAPSRYIFVDTSLVESATGFRHAMNEARRAG